MRNKELWQPSKFVYRNGTLRVNKDARDIGLSSWLAIDLVAAHYQQHLQQYVKGDLLDLGCGKVPFFEAYRQHVNSITCVDWAESLHDNLYIDKFCDLNKPLELDNNSFDSILCSDVLEHLTDPQKTLHEVARVLRPDGTFIINTPFMYWLHEQPHDHYRYTRFALERMAKNAGLEVVILKEIGGALEIVADVLSKFLAKIPVLGKFMTWCIQSSAMFWARSKVGKIFMLKTSNTMPMGYFAVFKKVEN